MCVCVCVRVCARACAGVGVFPEEYFDLSQPPDVGSPPHERAAWLASLPSTLREGGRDGGYIDAGHRGAKVRDSKEGGVWHRLKRVGEME